MLSQSSKLLLGVAGAALAMALGYHVAVDERAGVTLLLAVATAALVGAVATAGGAVPDHAPTVPDDAPPPERRATTTGSPPRGSGWPAVAAVAVGLLAAGAATGAGLVVAGLLAVLVATAGWFGRVWSEDPSWTRPVRERVTMRLLVPVGLPLATFLLALTIAVSVSRILLAVSASGAVVVALVVSVVVLSACAWVAARPRLQPSAVLALAAAAAVSMAGAGVTGAMAGEREFHPHEEEHGVVEVVAKGVKFDRDEITVAAGEKVVLEFRNEDGEVYHNVAVYQGEGPEDPPVFNGEGFAGHDERTYSFEAPPPGTYVFVCDFHPNMKGAFISEAE